MIMLMTCVLGLEPLCCPPDKEPLPDVPQDALPRPETDVLDTANPDHNACVIPGPFDGIA
jgi:hypothetical protein